MKGKPLALSSWLSFQLLTAIKMGNKLNKPREDWA